MDHTISADLMQKLTAAADGVNGLPDAVQRRHMVQDFLNRLDFKTVVVLPPEGMAEEQTHAIYRAIHVVIRALTDGVGEISIVGRKGTGRQFVGIAKPEGVPEPETFRENVHLSPDGGTYLNASVGPFDLHLPPWVDAQLACEISGVMWRIMRFILRGYNGLDEKFVRLARTALAKHGREHLVQQYTALSYMRWLYTIAGIRTFDYFGNEVVDTPDYFYGDLFSTREKMPSDYAESADFALDKMVE
jgi:hypothetical protein